MQSAHLRLETMYYVCTIITAALLWEPVLGVNICEVCECRGSGTLPGTEAICTPQITGKEILEVTAGWETEGVNRLLVRGFRHAKLDLSGMDQEVAASLPCKVKVEECGGCEMRAWWLGCDHTVDGVGRLEWRPGRHPGAPASLLLRHVALPSLRPGALALHLARQVVLEHIVLGKVIRGAVVLPLRGNESLFRIHNSTVLEVDKGGVWVRASHVVVTSCSLGPGAATGFRMEASNDVIIANNTFRQKDRNDFFDLYSEYIRMTNNTMRND